MARVLIVAVVALGGCTCKCDGPSGPRVDMDRFTDEVRDVFAGTFTGVVGAGRDDGTFPCGVAGAGFELVLTVDRPTCVDADDPDRGCARDDIGSFPLVGALTVDGADPYAVEGTIQLWSEPGGPVPMYAEAAVFDTTDLGSLEARYADTMTGQLDVVEVDAWEWWRPAADGDGAEACRLAVD